MENNKSTSPGSDNYQRALRFGTRWTVLTSPYLILSVVAIYLLGGLPVVMNDIPRLLEFAGTSHFVFSVIVMLDAIFHAMFFITAVTLYAIWRQTMPLCASLIIVGGAWQMVIGMTKGLTTIYTLSPLGTAYLAGNSTLQASLLPIAQSLYGLRLGLQAMDGFGVIMIWAIVSLLPVESGIPRSIRWLGWILSLALLAATPSGPTFFIVAILFPVWLFLIGQ